MPGRLGPRFALEAIFLIALAIAMGLADLPVGAIVAVMAVAWLLVAILEWLASRGADYDTRRWAPPASSSSWTAPEREEPVTELVPPEEAADLVEEAPRRRWFRRRAGGEASRAER